MGSKGGSPLGGWVREGRALPFLFQSMLRFNRCTHSFSYSTRAFTKAK
jgi:hypothetical protein